MNKILVNWIAALRKLCFLENMILQNILRYQSLFTKRNIESPVVEVVGASLVVSEGICCKDISKEFATPVFVTL